MMFEGKRNGAVDALRRKLLLFGLMMAMIWFWGGGASASAAGEVLSVPTVKALLNVPSLLEIHLELLEKEFGQECDEVRHPEIEAGPLQIQALASGSVQEANSLGATLILPAVASGLDLRIIGVNVRAPRAYALLLLDPAQKSLRDLAGRKIAGPKGTILHQLLWSALRREGMASADVEMVSMPQPEALMALLSGKVDGALLGGPLVLRAQKQGARVLVDGDGLIGGISYLVTTERLQKAHPNWPERFLKVRRDAVTFMKEHPEETLNLAAAESGLSKAEISAQMSFCDFSPDITDSDRKDIEEVLAFLKDNGFVDRPLATNELFPSR